MRTEKDLQNYIKAECKKAGVLFYKFSSPARRGVPDLLLVGLSGEIVFIELKSPSGHGTLSKLQKREIRLLKQQGCTVYVIQAPHEFQPIIARLIANG